MGRRAVAPKRMSGFTIVELLIVVVVIALLATIVLVAYNGITGQAKDATLKSDLKTGSTQLELVKVESGAYPSNGSALKASGDNAFHYAGGGDTYCLQVSSSSAKKTYRVTNASGIEEASCPAPATMQAMTPGFCASMAVYTGSNPSAVLSLTDSRGGTTRTYEVAKLADDNCWMLTNLKLGSTSGTITLTTADSDVASSFTLPQLYNGTSSTYRSYDTPYSYGPIPGDTGIGVANYGYLYNFPAATAGETRTSLAAGNAPHSICPLGWRLPTGGTSSSDFGRLDAAFGGTGAYADTGQPNIAQWQLSGQFRGVFSGYWLGGFEDQGDGGELWSASSASASGASSPNFSPDHVSLGDIGLARHNGGSVRCLLRNIAQ